MTPDLIIRDIKDPLVQKNFEALVQYFTAENQLVGFKFIEFSTEKAETNLKIRHTLGLIPRDLIRTRKTGAGSVTFNRHLFDAENMDITTTGAVKVRLLVGVYKNDLNQVADEPTDTETWT